MKGKSTPKIQRRAAGLQIRAALEPRPNSGANLASDIFRAVKENEAIEAKSAQIAATLTNSIETGNSSLPQITATRAVQPAATNDSDSGNFDEQLSQDRAEIVPGTALVRFGEGQMRVVSLQQSNKSRKVNKQPKKLLRIVTGTNQTEKIPILFERTKAEELYDLLYQLTLGADEPCASVRVRRSDLMASTNIKTRLTLDLNLKRLEENDLLKIESRPGEQEGNIYTVFPLPNGEKS
ncbi:MAG: hypothetical protein ABI954_05780 [Pyrinomonadaceae bacterium]